METEEPPKAPKGLLIGLAIVMLVIGGALTAEFVLKAQPCLNCSATTTTTGEVDMPAGVGSNIQLNFAPASITVVIGVNNTVNFVNKDTVTHTVTATGGSFDSGDIKAGATWTHTFTTPGTYTYYCIYHSWMKGTVKVVASTSGGSGATITIPSGTASSGSLSYSPSHFTVVIGTNNTVTFVNQDSATHTVTADGGSFDSGDILAGQSWTYTFTTPGTYSFHCIYHSWMKGTVTVVAAS